MGYSYFRTKKPELDEREPVVGYTQWSQLNDGSGFTPVGKTVSQILPGYYDLASVEGQIYFVPVRARTDSLLEFPDSASKDVLSGIVDFWEREKLFQRYGLPYKRGILMFGPPGSGKSCTLQLVAREVVDRGGIVVTFQPSIFLYAYRAFRDIQPETKMVVLMEDFETLMKGNESKVLNLLDGVEALDNVVFLATTNYPERLETRVMNRPSRFDICIKVDHPTAAGRKIYIESLLKEGDEVDVEQYVTDTDNMSLAHLKELFVSTVILGRNYTETVDRLTRMRDNSASSVDDEKTGATIGNFM